MAVQMGLTSIRVSWTPSSDATGYIISYTGGSSSESVTVSGGSSDNYLLTGLQNGDTYTISIVATSDGLKSESVIVMNVQLGKLVFVPCNSIYSHFSSSRPANSQHRLHIIHIHLPLLQCSQWLSGDQL